MRTTGIGSYTMAYGNGIDFANLKQSNTKDATASDKTSGTSGGKTSATGAYAGATSGTLALQLRSLFEGMKLSGGSQVSFASLQKYREGLEASFSETVRKDLLALGVDKDIEFRLASDGQGGVSVVSNHADKAKIEKYFKDNPDMVAKFNDIQALTGLDQARKAQQISPAALRTRIQMESMALWFDSTSNGGGSSILDFNMQASNFLASINRRV
jgi:hypothetical protein